MYSATSYLLFSLAAGFLSAYLALRAGKNPFAWFGIGAAFGLFGVLPIFFLNFRKKEPLQKTLPQQMIYFIDGPQDKYWYYLDPEMKQEGPLSFYGLTSAWKSGKIDSTTYVWNEELTEWKPLREFIKFQTLS